MAKKDKKAAPEKDSSAIWSVFSLVTALFSAAVAKKVLDSSWKATTGKQPPTNPADPDVSTGEAVAWAVASGTFVAVAKMLASRRAANYYTKSTGHLPPGLGADADEAVTPKG
jgi:hypothetical protein